MLPQGKRFWFMRLAMHIVSCGQTSLSHRVLSELGDITLSVEERSGHLKLQCMQITQHYLATQEGYWLSEFHFKPRPKQTPKEH